MDDLGYPTPPWRKQEAPSGNELDTRARLDFLRSVTPNPQKRGSKRPLIVVAMVVVLAVLGLAVYWQFFHSAAKPAPQAKTSARSAASSTSNGGKTPDVPTQPYASSNFNLSFNYPDGWSVVDNGSGIMTVTSPGLPLTSAAGQTVTSLITMTIQKQGQLPAAFSAGPALAVLNSQTLAYSQPTASQTSQAYLSFVQYSSTTTKGGLDAIYLTGNYGYQKDQTIPATDIANVNPLVTVSFTKCGNTACTSNLTPLTIASASWSQAALQAPIMTMLASLAFQ